MRWALAIISFYFPLAGLVALGQEPPSPPSPPFPLEPIDFVQVMEAFERVVEGAPYQARAVTEITQELTDGNRISRSTTTSIQRDSAGRIRREITLAAIGPVIPQGDPPRTTVILDPAAGRGYQLEERSRVARRLRQPEPRLGPGGEPPPEAFGPQGPRRPGSPPPAAPVSESLGRKTIEGVEADGTRTTFTIPPGEVGNEKPIRVVHERWWSPELQTVILSRRSDPRFGLTVYRLTDITRSEPDPKLFEIPEGYEVVDEPVGGRPPRPPGPRRGTGR